jgi:hypothetical protein
VSGKLPWRAPGVFFGERMLTADGTRAKREALLAAFQRKCKTAQGDELDHYLRSALILCADRPPPAWLFALLIKRLGRPLTVDEKRWYAVRWAKDEEGLPWVATSVGDDPDSPTVGRVREGERDARGHGRRRQRQQHENQLRQGRARAAAQGRRPTAHLPTAPTARKIVVQLGQRQLAQ